MDDSGAILCQISSSKDMLDQVNDEIEANVQIKRESESKIVECSEIHSALAVRASDLTKTLQVSHLENNELAIDTGTSATVMGDDSSNPYFLHHEESLLMPLVKQPLTEENYHSWSRLMVIALTAKNKIGFVNGSITAPSISSPLYNAWERCNAMVLLWLWNSLSKEIAASVIYLDTAREVWLYLKERYSQNNGTRVFQLHKAIASLRQDQASVISYFAKLKGLWDELMSYHPIPDCSMCSCGALKTLVDYRQHEIVMKFLMGLNDSFSNVRGEILLMDPLPPINKVYSLVVQEEKLREICSVSITAHVAEPMTLAANTKSSFGSKNTARKDTPVCIHCGFTGHTVDKCYKIHGCPWMV